MNARALSLERKEKNLKTGKQLRLEFSLYKVSQLNYIFLKQLRRGIKKNMIKGGLYLGIKLKIVLSYSAL
jgi:hypothetical protein